MSPRWEQGIGNCRQCYQERGPLPQGAFDPDLAAVGMDNFTTNRESRAGPFVVVARMKPAEHLEDPGVELGIDPNAVVPYEERRPPAIVNRPNTDLHPGLLLSIVLHTVTDQVAEE